MNDTMALSSDNNTPDGGGDQKEGTTTFIATDSVAIREAPLSLQARISKSYFPNDVQSVIQYLNKPVPITSGAWSTGSTAGTLLYNQDSWVGVWNTTMWNEKLHGFYGLRATLKIDLILNANPFQAGRLRLCYYPAAVLNRPKAAAHISHRTPLSQLPGIDIGCGDEMVTLNIPYVTPARYIELTSSIISWGDIYLAIMSPLITGASGSSTADYTLWYSLQDVELFGQTNKAVSQQSVVGKRKVSQKINPTEREIKPISHVLGSAADFASSVSQIPLLSPWAGPVSWFLNAAKGAAISFGFSKPVNTEVPCMMSSNYHFHVTSSDGVDNAAPLAINYDAKLPLLDDVSEGGKDEMSIRYICSQWAFLEEFTLSTSDTLGLQLYSQQLLPTDFVTNVGTNEFYYTPIAYLAKLYSLYRGGFEFRFKFIKTGFHAGSLAFTFVPGPADSSLSLTNTSYCYRTVLDLQEGDEACFRCPYLLPLDFIDVNVSAGRIYVHVVNPLRAPETCASTFKVLVYVRGADSLQFQKPAHTFNGPFVVIPQGGAIDEISSEIVCETPGDGPVAELDYEFCQQTISECSTSLLQLLKRYNQIQFQLRNPSTEDTFTLSPWSLSAARYTAATFTYPPQMNDFIMSLVMAPFAFMRGSIRLRLTSCTSGSDVNNAYVYRFDTTWSNSAFVTSGTTTDSIFLATWDVGAATNAPPSTITGPVFPSTMSAGGTAVQVPFQGPYRFCCTTYAYLSSSVMPFEWPRPLVSVYFGSTRKRLVTRSVGDDFQALFWVGIPRLSA